MNAQTIIAVEAIPECDKKKLLILCHILVTNAIGISACIVTKVHPDENAWEMRSVGERRLPHVERHAYAEQLRLGAIGGYPDVISALLPLGDIGFAGDSAIRAPCEEDCTAMRSEVGDFKLRACEIKSALGLDEVADVQPDCALHHGVAVQNDCAHRTVAAGDERRGDDERAVADRASAGNGLLLERAAAEVHHRALRHVEAVEHIALGESGVLGPIALLMRSCLSESAALHTRSSL